MNKFHSSQVDKLDGQKQFVDQKYYKESFLQEGSMQSEHFLKECTYLVDLKQLYQMVSTCYYHEGMKFCPVLVKVNGEISNMYHCKYLLQVWNQKGEKIFERKLENPVIRWAICYNYLIFKPEGDDENSDYYHLVNLDLNNSEYLIRDFVNDPSYQHMAFNDGLFYLANSNEIKLLNVQDSQISPGIVNFDDSQVAVVSLEGLKIHGLFLNQRAVSGKTRFVIVAIENRDNQVEFNSLVVMNKQLIGSEDLKYTFIQMCEIVPRHNEQGQEWRNDPIEKVVLSFTNKENQFGVAVRKSHKFDLYYQFQRLPQSIQAEQVLIVDAELTFDSIYLRIDKNEVRVIKENLKNRMTYESNTGYLKYTDDVFFEKIKNHCKIINSFCLLNRILILAHNHVISLYSITDQEWFYHFTMDHEIENIFRQQNERGEFEVVILDHEGAIKVLKHKEKATPEHGHEEHHQVVSAEDKQARGWHFDDHHTYHLNGELVEYGQDREDNKWTLFLTKSHSNQPILTVLYHNKMYNITDEVPKLTIKHNFVFLSSPSDNTEFIIQDGKHVVLYDIVLPEDGDRPEIREIIEFEQIESLTHTIHSAIRFRDPRYMFLVDAQNFYKVDLEKKEVKCFEDQNCVGLYFCDMNFLYTLSRSSVTKEGVHREGGLRLYDIENVIHKNRDNSYLLTDHVQVGCQSFIDFSEPNQRLVFQSSYKAIEVLPVLHRNAISFIGMQKRPHYLAVKREKDKFIALSHNNTISTWNILSGKLLGEQRLKRFGQDYKEYDIYQFSKKDLTYLKEWYPWFLLRKRTAVEDFDEASFYQNALTKANIKNQVPFIKRVKKSFYEFKLIEILNENEVKEHFSFIHPQYLDEDGNVGQKHQLIFSEDLNYMYETLPSHREFLYERAPQKDQDLNKVTWKKIHRFHNLPTNIMHDCQYPFIFSPDFTLYLDYDLLKHQFIIRKTQKEEHLLDIPENLLNTKHEDQKTIANRFCWIDNQTIWVVNHEGIERYMTIDYKKKTFTERQFNFIPMYDKDYCKHHHIGLDKPGLKIDDVLHRLIRKYQFYKTQYNLEGNAVPMEMYEHIFTVDYRVNDCLDRYTGDLSFTYLHWTIIEQLEKGTLQIEQMDKKQIELLIYNILPGGNTVMHKLFHKGETLEKLLEMCHPTKDEQMYIKFEIPFLKNLANKSPIHYCLEKSDYRNINLMLQYLSLYKADHHSRAIEGQLHGMVMHKIENLIPYLDSRTVQTDSISKLNKGQILEKSHGMTAASFWLDPRDKEKLLAKPIKEIDIKLEFIDIPILHSYSQESDLFFNELSQTHNMDFFKIKAIKKFIDFKWPLVLEYTVKKLFIPFILFQISYVVYMSGIYVNRDDPEAPYMQTLNNVFQGILLFFSFYFCMIEISQLIQEGFTYLFSIWNYLDLLPPFLLITFIPLEQIGTFDSGNKGLEGSMQAIMSLVMWLKLLYFLRIFDSTGYLIKIIIEVIIDMKYFLMILMLTFVAFADSMYQINTSNKEEDYFITEPYGWIGSVLYIYRMSLGDMQLQQQMGQVVPWLVWLLFVLGSMFIMIIMLNLLIAIISEAFTRIYSVSDQAAYQEKATIISENSYLIPPYRKRAFCEKNKYLLLAVDAEIEQAEQEDPIQHKLNVMEKKMKGQMKELGKKLIKAGENMEMLKVDNKKMLEILSRIDHVEQPVAHHH